QLRAYMGKLLTRYLNQIADESIPGDSSPVAREAGRILAAYQVVEADALEYAPGLETLLKKLYRVDHERFAELRQTYEPLLRKYGVIHEYLGEMTGQPTPQGKALMQQYSITENDVVRVRNMLLKPSR